MSADRAIVDARQTADEKAARQLAGHPRVKLLTTGTSRSGQ
jgi:hypothetical protein